VASILLPPLSGDYTLLHLYIPWAVLALISISLKDGQIQRGLVFSFVCMAILMAPESWLFVYGIRVAGQLKAVVLLILFIVSITCPFEEPAAGCTALQTETTPSKAAESAVLQNADSPQRMLRRASTYRKEAILGD